MLDWRFVEIKITRPETLKLVESLLLPTGLTTIFVAYVSADPEQVLKNTKTR